MWYTYYASSCVFCVTDSGAERMEVSRIKLEEIWLGIPLLHPCYPPHN